jgi:hypothetical protein
MDVRDVAACTRAPVASRVILAKLATRSGGASRVASVLGIVAAVLALTAAPASAETVPAGFHLESHFTAAATFVARKPVAVACANTYTDWRAWVGAHVGDANGSAQPGGDVAKLSPDACRYLRDRQRGRAVSLYSIAASLLVLVHESIHLRGEHDEGVTDCAASHEMVGVARQFFGFKTRTAIRALMAQVAKVRDREPAVYRSVC